MVIFMANIYKPPWAFALERKIWGTIFFTCVLMGSKEIKLLLKIVCGNNSTIIVICKEIRKTVLTLKYIHC